MMLLVVALHTSNSNTFAHLTPLFQLFCIHIFFNYSVNATNKAAKDKKNERNYLKKGMWGRTVLKTIGGYDKFIGEILLIYMIELYKNSMHLLQKQPNADVWNSFLPGICHV